jgi:hypothetical protein
MFIFYDFETSSKEQIGQILTYSFLVVDDNYNIKDELTGAIKLNRTQLPDIDAILTNKIDVLELQKIGDPEPEAATKIHKFLGKQVHHYGNAILVGYNSNSFDLNFLRGLLIRYGLNPYYMGKLKNLDILHYVHFIAFENPDSFLWQKSINRNDLPYYSFKLEFMAKAYGLLEGSQTHSAREDVILTIDLVKALESKHQLKLKNFLSIKLPVNFSSQLISEVAKQKTTHYLEKTGEPLQKFVYNYWQKIFGTNKEKVVLNLKKYREVLAKEIEDKKEYQAAVLGAIRYINHNKHFFVLEPFSDSERSDWQPVIDQSENDDFLKSLSRDNYFALTKKDWDIEYQIHELGFERIDRLNILVKKLFQDPNQYQDLLASLLRSRSDEKDNHLIRLFNRVYLNFHPSPDPAYMLKYLEPRYIKGTMLRDQSELVLLDDYKIRLDEIINSTEYQALDRKIISSLKQYFINFKKML